MASQVPDGNLRINKDALWLHLGVQGCQPGVHAPHIEGQDPEGSSAEDALGVFQCIILLRQLWGHCVTIQGELCVAEIFQCTCKRQSVSQVMPGFV